MTLVTPTPPAHLLYVGQRRTCSRWRRGSATTSMTRCAGCGDITLLGTPLTPEVLDLVILGARVASAAGDAGLRARVLQATEALERERPPVPLFAGVAGYARGILERDAQALVAAADVASNRRRGRFFTPALPRTPAAS